jgi:hypothetical protein
MKLYNFWSWPAQLISDIREWNIVRKALKEVAVQEKFKTFKYELRIDNLSRVYTVINIPEELWEYDKRNMVWPWMLEQLRELDEMLMTVQLNDLLYPEVDKIADAPAYLVILKSSRESISFWKFLRWLFNCVFVTFSLIIINALIAKIFGQSIIQFFISLF